MIKENFIYRFLRRFGLFKDREDERFSDNIKIQMCHKAKRSNICSGDCDSCAWRV